MFEPFNVPARYVANEAALSPHARLASLYFVNDSTWQSRLRALVADHAQDVPRAHQAKNRQSQPGSMPHIMFVMFVVPLVHVAIQNVFVLVPPEAGRTGDVRRARHARGDPGPERTQPISWTLARSGRALLATPRCFSSLLKTSRQRTTRLVRTSRNATQIRSSIDDHTMNFRARRRSPRPVGHCTQLRSASAVC